MAPRQGTLREGLGQSRARQGHEDRAPWLPTFHVEGLELGQVPNGTRQICQLVSFHIQHLGKNKR